MFFIALPFKLNLDEPEIDDDYVGQSINSETFTVACTFAYRELSKKHFWITENAQSIHKHFIKTI